MADGAARPPAPEYDTTRLHLRDWHRFRDTPKARATLEQALDGLLTPAVLRHLPPAVQRRATEPETGNDMANWIAERDRNGVAVSCIRAEDRLIGLLFLFGEAAQTLHFGYLLGETAWGKGYATECVNGLLTHLRRTRVSGTLLAGVDMDNPASARVLEKTGFQALPAQAGTLHFAFPLDGS